MQDETNIPPISIRIHGTQSSLLAKIARTLRKSNVEDRLQQALLQNEQLFIKKTAARAAGKTIKQMDLKETIINLKHDISHENYSHHGNLSR